MRRRSVLTTNLGGGHGCTSRLARHRRGWVGTRVLLGTAPSLDACGRALTPGLVARRAGLVALPPLVPLGLGRARQYRAGTPAPLYGAHAARLPRASAVRLGDRARGLGGRWGMVGCGAVLGTPELAALSGVPQGAADRGRAGVSRRPGRRAVPDAGRLADHLRSRRTSRPMSGPSFGATGSSG